MPAQGDRSCSLKKSLQGIGRTLSRNIFPHFGKQVKAIDARLSAVEAREPEKGEPATRERGEKGERGDVGLARRNRNSRP